MFRLVGLVISMGFIGYLLYAVLSADSKIAESINNNPAVQEQQNALKSAGVDATDKEAVKNYALEQARQLEAYQNQVIPPME